MKEPHSEGVANHADLESCGGGGDAAAEALTEALAGRLWSREILRTGRRPCGQKGKATSRRAIASGARARRGRWNPSTPENSPRENRETSAPLCEAGRWVKAKAVRPTRTGRRSRSRPYYPRRVRTKAGNRRRRIWREGPAPRRTFVGYAPSAPRGGQRCHRGRRACGVRLRCGRSDAIIRGRSRMS